MSGARGKAAEELTGVQKSAVLCVALGPKAAAQAFQHLSPDEIEQLSREIAALPSVETPLMRSIVEEFLEVSTAVDSVARGGIDYARKVLEQALGPGRAGTVLDKIRNQVHETGLKRLRQAPPEALAGILRGEHPQTVALILAHLDSRRAVSVIEALDSELAADVLYRMARMEKVAPEMLAVVEGGLGGKADLSLSQEMTQRGGPATVAEVLNLMTGTKEKQLLGTIEKRNADVAKEIRSLMFVFEDLLMLDGKSVQRVLREIEGKELALAMRAISPELKQHIKSNMSERAAGALEDEIDMMGPVRVKDVEGAHARIIEVVRTLEESGEIMIRGRGGDDDIIT